MLGKVACRIHCNNMSEPGEWENITECWLPGKESSLYMQLKVHVRYSDKAALCESYCDIWLFGHTSG